MSFSPSSLRKFFSPWLSNTFQISTSNHLHQLLSLAVVSGDLRQTSTRLPLLNAILHSLARGSAPALALSLYDSLRVAGILAPDSYTFTSALKAASLLRSTQTGRKIQALSLKMGLGTDAFVLNSLIHFYSSSGLVEIAREVFDSAPDSARDVVSWNSMIAGYSQSSRSEEAVLVFVEMVKKSFGMDGMTPVGALMACGRIGDLNTGRKIHALVVVNGLELDFYLGSSLVSMYAKCGAVDDARKLFDGMPERNVVCWTSMIAGYAQSGRFVESIELFRDMQIDGVQADDATIASVVSSCAQVGALDQGRYAHAYADIHGLGKSLNVKNALIDMYSKCGDIARATEIFGGLACRRDVFSWTVMISCMAMNGSSKEALDLFCQMEASGDVVPNEITFLGVLSACSHGGLVGEGYYYFDRMIKVYELTPRIEHYGCMIDLLGRAKLVVQAMQFIREMPVEPDVVIWRSLLFACRANGNVEVAEFAADQIIRLEPGRCGSNVLLSNVYASTSRWREANRARRLMYNKSIQKEPGCSFIEVDGAVYEFLVSDTTHRQITDIHRTLWGLNRLLLSEICSPDT